MDHLAKFQKAFTQGLNFFEAAKTAGVAPSNLWAEYWNLLTMEVAVAKSRAYYDKLIELAQ